MEKKLNEFFCNHFGVGDITEIKNPFSAFPIHTWQPGREAHVTAKLGSQDIEKDLIEINKNLGIEEQATRCVLGDASRCTVNGSLQPRRPFINPYNKQPTRGDLDNVSIFSIVARHCIRGIPCPMAVRMNYEHESLYKAEKTEDADKIFNLFGNVNRAFFALPPTEQAGKDIKCFALRTMNHHYNNIEFVRSLFLVNESNLMNGIIEIPQQVCRDANLINFNPDANPSLVSQFMDSGFQKVSHWYAIPKRHVLSWALIGSTDEYRRKVLKMLVVDYPSTNNTLFYLVQDVAFHSMVKGFKENWLGKVDKRRLMDIGVEFLPMLNTVPQNVETNIFKGCAQITLSIGYMVFPQIPDSVVATLAPTLSPNFPIYN